MKLKRFIISYKENEQFPKGTVKSKLKFQFWFLLLFLATQCDKIIKEHKVFFFLLDCIEPVDQVGKSWSLDNIEFSYPGTRNISPLFNYSLIILTSELWFPSCRYYTYFVRFMPKYFNWGAAKVNGFVIFIPNSTCS